MIKKQLNRYTIIIFVMIIFVGCEKTSNIYSLYLNDWNEYKYNDTQILGNLLYSYSFDDKCSKIDSLTNVYIFTQNAKQNDTIILFDINCTSNIDTIMCRTCKDISFDIVKITSKPKVLNIPLKFKKSQFNNSQKYKCVFGKNIVNIID